MADEYPMLFSGPMVRALLNGTKTKTRRVIKEYKLDWELCSEEMEDLELQGWWSQYGHHFKLPSNHRVNDIIYVREAWRTWKDFDDVKPSKLRPDVPVFWEADRDNCDRHGKLRPGMFLPKHFSRIKRLVTGLRVEKLQDITHQDAIDEGVRTDMDQPNPINAYAELWDSLNADRGHSWESNPWVSVTTLKSITTSVSR